MGNVILCLGYNGCGGIHITISKFHWVYCRPLMNDSLWLHVSASDTMRHLFMPRVWHLASSKQPFSYNAVFSLSLYTNQPLQTIQCGVLLANPYILFLCLTKFIVQGPMTLGIY